MNERPLSEWEASILSYLVFGAASGYEVKRAFEQATSSHWSASAGSVYPALRRMEESGFVTSKQQETNRNKGHSLYSVTDLGLEKIHELLEAAPEHKELSALFDPIRLRVQLLHLMPKQRQKELLRIWIEKAREYEQFIQNIFCDKLKETRPIHYIWALEYVHSTAKLRVKWLSNILTYINSLAGDNIE